MEGDSRPIPDPTERTIQALHRDIAALRELLEARLEGLIETAESKRQAMRAHYDSVISERDRRYEERFQASQTATEAAFAASEKAIQKAEVSIEKRADATYVALGELQKILQGLIPRQEAESRQADQEKRLSDLASRLDRMEAAKTGGRDQLTGIYALAGFVLTLLALGGILAAAGVFGT